MLAIKFFMHIFQALAYPVAYLFCKYAMNFGYDIYLERHATIRNIGESDLCLQSCGQNAVEFEMLLIFNKWQ